LIIPGSEFLRSHRDTWISRRAREFEVVNVHSIDIAARAARIFPELTAMELLLPRWHWRALFGVRALVGRIFGWDHGLAWQTKQPAEAGKQYAFFRIDHTDAPRELGMSFENKLTRAVMTWVLDETALGTAVFNVTCAHFYGWQGRAYWGAIRPFHNGLIEDSLGMLRKRSEDDRAQPQVEAG
jgi:hypothetical protein